MQFNALCYKYVSHKPFRQNFKITSNKHTSVKVLHLAMYSFSTFGSWGSFFVSIPCYMCNYIPKKFLKNQLFLFIAPYVKVYLIDGKHCVEKQKTTVARRTLDPLYQQQLAFTEDYRGKILQVCIQYIYKAACC